MVDSGSEVALWGLEGVVGGEVDVEEVHTTGVGRFIRSHDSCLPMELVFLVNRPSRAVGWRVLTQINQFLLNSF